MAKSSARARKKGKAPDPKRGFFGSIRAWIKRTSWARPRQWIIALILAALVVIADQISKALVASNLYVGQTVWLINPLLKVTYAQNEYGIFSISFGSAFLHLLLPLCAVIFVLIFLTRPQKTFVTVLMGVILGGGLGNLVDRILHGYVVDWISMGFRNWRWATYNVADGSVVVSVILLLVYEFFFSKPKKKEEAEEETSN